MNLVNAKKQIIYPGFISRIFSTSLDLIIMSLFLTIFGSAISRKIFIYYFRDFITKYQIDLLRSDALYQMSVMPEFVEYQNLRHFVIYLFLSFIFNILFMLIYFIGFWKLFDSTPGKLLMGMKIVDINETSPNTAQYIKRFFGYFLFPIGIWSILTNKYKQALHDKIAKTFVIKK